MVEFKDCTPLFNALGENFIETLPVLDIGLRCGSTDYIDFITIEDMTSSIMKGTDCHKRPFIAIKVKCAENGVNKYAVGTFFQRYSDESKSWAFGTCYETNIIYYDSRVRITDYHDLESRLKKIFNRGTVHNVKFWGKNITRPIDMCNGNGTLSVTLA